VCNLPPHEGENPVPILFNPNQHGDYFHKLNMAEVTLHDFQGYIRKTTQLLMALWKGFFLESSCHAVRKSKLAYAESSHGKAHGSV
jgi:hypothetical protein